MGRLPRALEEKRVKLLALARRRAFESYIRYGRVSKLHEQAVALAVDAEKALGPGVDVSVEALPGLKPTTYYTWRSAGDERVRLSHAALHGRIFAWNAPSAHGHPGGEFNCRCWAEPYYGNPNVPDALLQVAQERQVDTTGRERWASIETLTRPDGTLVESAILGRDGTQFRSSFSGSSVRHAVTLPVGDKVRFETTSGVQSIYLGDDGTPLFQSTWSADGPKVLRAKRRVAFLLDDPLDLDAIIDGDYGPRQIEVFKPNPAGDLFDPSTPSGLGIVALGLLGLYLMQRAAPASLGAGTDDVPFIAFKAWTYDGRAGAMPVLANTLAKEQIRQSCERLPEIQKLADELEDVLASQRQILGPQNYGIEFHWQLKRRIDTLKEAFPLAYEGVHAELSIDGDGLPTSYGNRGSTRLDILEEIPPVTPELVCDYDIKTGDTGIKPRQLNKIIESTAKKYPGVNVVVVEVKPKNVRGR